MVSQAWCELCQAVLPVPHQHVAREPLQDWGPVPIAQRLRLTATADIWMVEAPQASECRHCGRAIQQLADTTWADADWARSCGLPRRMHQPMPTLTGYLHRCPSCQHVHAYPPPE